MDNIRLRLGKEYEILSLPDSDTAEMRVLGMCIGSVFKVLQMSIMRGVYIISISGSSLAIKTSILQRYELREYI